MQRENTVIQQRVFFSNNNNKTGIVDICAGDKAMG